MSIILFLVSGIALLYFGAEWLVKGSSNIALRAGVPSLVVGLTIVAFGTSAPELAVSIKAGFDGLGDIAVGNVVGSNIFNICVILGLSAIVHPMKVNAQVLQIDTPIMVIVSFLPWILLKNDVIGRTEGAFLTVAIVVFTVFTIFWSKKNSTDLSLTPLTVKCKVSKPISSDIYLIILGLVALVIGSRLFVSGAIDLARTMNISEAVIGLTIVAAGTSLPELATSIVAAIKGEEDIAIGNIVGSNVFNILAILGIASVLNPIHSKGIGLVDLAFMTGSSLLLLPLMRSGFRLVRSEGFILLAVYSGYLWYLWP